MGDEKKAIANFKYWIDTNTERGVCYLPDYICTKVLNIIEELQKENEELKNKLSLKQFDINIVYNDYLEKLYKYEQNSIPIQKIKDKIKKNKNLVEESNDGDIIRKLNQENEVLQDLLEEEKQWEKYTKVGN